MQYLLFFLKVIIFFWISTDMVLLGGGNDSDFYQAYTLGYHDVITSLRQVFLWFLHDIGLYNRDIGSLCLFWILRF